MPDDEKKDPEKKTDEETTQEKPADDEDDDDTDPDSKMIVETFDPVMVTCHQDSFIRFWSLQVTDQFL